MEIVKYIVKARDDSGHEFVKTFLHPMTEPRRTLGSPAGASALREMILQYEDAVLSAAPFCCVACGRAATDLLHMHTARLTADPVVFDIPLPYCGSSACVEVALARARAATKDMGHGTQHYEVDQCTGAQGPPKYKNLNHLALVKLTACVVCGDTVNLKKCSRCRVIPYCSEYCQKVEAHHFSKGNCY